MDIIEPYDPAILTGEVSDTSYRFTRRELRRMKRFSSLERALRENKLRGRYGDYSYEFRRGLLVLEVCVEYYGDYVVYTQLDTEVLRTKDLGRTINYIQKWLKQLQL